MDADPRIDPTPDAATAPPQPLEVRPPPQLAVRIRALVEVLACSGYPTQLAIGLLLTPLGLGLPQESGALTLRGLTTLLTLDSIVVVGLVWWFLKADHEAPAAVLIGPRRWQGEALVGVALLPVIFMLVVTIGLAMAKLAPWMRAPVNPFGALIGSSQDLVVLALVGLVAGGIREEVQRAFILHRFEQHLGGALVGLACFSVLFGLGHVVQGWPAVITTTALGAFWGLVYLRRRSIVAPVVSHAAFNLFQTLVFKLRV